MAGRTIAIGDIHGDLEALENILAQLPTLDADDTLVFLGDYVDRGLQSKEVVELVRVGIHERTPAKIIKLMGNHEEAWLRVAKGEWPEFVLPAGNGCLACCRSYLGVEHDPKKWPEKHEMEAMMEGSFFPPEVLKWFAELAWWYEDEHAIYVHAGLNENDDGSWPHPRDVKPEKTLVWTRSRNFFEHYEGKRIIVGHTPTPNLPPELSEFTPEDPDDMWVNDEVFAIDTGCGKGGFLTAFELPGEKVYESRET